MSRIADTARRGAACALAALALANAAAGQGVGLPGPQRDQPIEIEAEDSLEWLRDERAYVARGNARAAQADFEVRGAMLKAYYRERDDGGTAITRLEAEGEVRITTPTHAAYGERAVYDVERGVLMVTGRDLRLETATDLITARDSLEYHEARDVAVARGDAVAARGERRLRAEVLTARFERAADGTRRIAQIDGVDGVQLSTPCEIVRAREGTYDVASGVVELTGAVRITRGGSQLAGERAEFDLETGASRLFGGVRGLIDPRDLERERDCPAPTIAR